MRGRIQTEASLTLKPMCFSPQWPCCIPPTFFFFNWFGGWEIRREGEKEKERNIDLLFHLFMHSLTASCMFQLEIEPTTLAHRDDAPTNWATWPGPPSCLWHTQETRSKNPGRLRLRIPVFTNGHFWWISGILVLGINLGKMHCSPLWKLSFPDRPTRYSSAHQTFDSMNSLSI